VAPLPNNPMKLPFFVLCGVIGIGVAVVGLLYGTWWLVALGAGVALGSVFPILLIRRGDNPRWLQAPLDRRGRER
jgi:hypothetical protein